MAYIPKFAKDFWEPTDKERAAELEKQKRFSLPVGGYHHRRTSPFTRYTLIKIVSDEERIRMNTEAQRQGERDRALARIKDYRYRLAPEAKEVVDRIDRR